jgi:excinuclease UvrABC nuclease subunit
VQVKPRPPTKWVYNLEVQGEHVYEVGPNGVLVHNHCATAMLFRNGKLVEGSKKVFTSGGSGIRGKLSFPQQVATHTEAKIVREFQGIVKEGDHLVIRGSLPPCNICQRRMKELVAATGAKVSYKWKDGKKQMLWMAERVADGRVKVTLKQGSEVIRKLLWKPVPGKLR